MEQSKAPTLLDDGLFSPAIGRQVQITTKTNKITTKGHGPVTKVTPKILRFRDTFAAAFAATFAYSLGFSISPSLRYQRLKILQDV
jgi:hypothetical protein